MLRKLLLPFLFVLLLLSSCSEDNAADGSERGTLAYAGSVVKNGKEYFIFVYSRMETIASADQSASYFYYLIAYTVDARTGKIVHQTTYDCGEEAAVFAGVSVDYTFFYHAGGMCAMDLHAENKTLEAPALKKRIAGINALNEKTIAGIEVDAYKNLRLLTTTGDLYLLRTKDLQATLITNELQNDPAYQLQFSNSLLGEVQLLNNFYNGFVINDTSTLVLTSLNPSNVHKKFLYLGTHPSRSNFANMMRNFNMQQIDSAFFLDGSDIGVKDSVVFLTYTTSLGKNGKELIGAYDWNAHRFLWSKPVHSLYTAEQPDTRYSIYWNTDGSAFLIGEVSNSYVQLSLVDSKTGKVKWRF